MLMNREGIPVSRYLIAFSRTEESRHFTYVTHYSALEIGMREYV